MLFKRVKPTEDEGLLEHRDDFLDILAKKPTKSS
jgi:hypothetical protein